MLNILECLVVFLFLSCLFYYGLPPTKWYVEDNPTICSFMSHEKG